jgi:hypothetical protein
MHLSFRFVSFRFVSFGLVDRIKKKKEKRKKKKHLMAHAIGMAPSPWGRTKIKKECPTTNYPNNCCYCSFELL